MGRLKKNLLIITNFPNDIKDYKLYNDYSEKQKIDEVKQEKNQTKVIDEVEKQKHQIIGEVKKAKQKKILFYYYNKFLSKKRVVLPFEYKKYNIYSLNQLSKKEVDDFSFFVYISDKYIYIIYNHITISVNKLEDKYYENDLNKAMLTIKHLYSLYTASNTHKKIFYLIDTEEELTKIKLKKEFLKNIKTDNNEIKDGNFKTTDNKIDLADNDSKTTNNTNNEYYNVKLENNIKEIKPNFNNLTKLSTKKEYNIKIFNILFIITIFLFLLFFDSSKILKKDINNLEKSLNNSNKALHIIETKLNLLENQYKKLKNCIKKKKD